MPRLVACPACGAHVLASACACPHCAATLRTCRGAVATTAAAAAMGLILGACDGVKPQPDYGIAHSGLETGLEDADGDGFTPSDGDCDDGDASIHPGAAETAGDGVDSDCDGAD